MNRSQRFALIREAMDMLSFTDAAINVQVEYEARNGDVWDSLEISRLEGRSLYRVVSRPTGASVIQVGVSSQVMHDLRALIDRNYDITWISLVAWGRERFGGHEDGAWQDVKLYPGEGYLPLPRRRLRIDDWSNTENLPANLPENHPLFRGPSNESENDNDNDNWNDNN